MKAKSIYEQLDFERGISPKKAMNIGKEKTWSDIRDKMRLDGWKTDDDTDDFPEVERDIDSALGWAVDYGHIEYVDWLIEEGAEKTVELLTWAVQNKDTNMIKALLKHGLNPAGQNSWPMKKAIDMLLIDVVKLFTPYFSEENLRNLLRGTEFEIKTI